MVAESALEYFRAIFLCSLFYFLLFSSSVFCVHKRKCLQSLFYFHSTFFPGVRHELRFLVDPSRKIVEVGRVKKAPILSQQIMISTSASSYKSAKKGKFFYLLYSLVFRFRRWVQMMFGIVSSPYILTQFHNMLSKGPNSMLLRKQKGEKLNWILEMWSQRKTADLKPEKKPFSFVDKSKLTFFYCTKLWSNAALFILSRVWCISGNFSSCLSTNVFSVH